MKITLIRHTKVAVEPGVCYGQNDVGVHDSFEEEIKAVKKKLSESTFEKIFCSPLFRCKVLAENVIPNQEINYDERLKELNFGDWELKRWDEIYKLPEGKNWMNNFKTLPAKNGESYPEMVLRVEGFFNEIQQNKHKSIAVFTHAGVIRIIKSLVERVSIDTLFETFKPGYGSVTVFETENKLY